MVKPGAEAAGMDTHAETYRPQRKYGAMLGDERVSHFSYLAKCAAAFSKMPRSSVTRASSHLNKYRDEGVCKSRGYSQQRTVAEDNCCYFTLSLEECIPLQHRRNSSGYPSKMTKRDDAGNDTPQKVTAAEPETSAPRKVAQKKAAEGRTNELKQRIATRKANPTETETNVICDYDSFGKFIFRAGLYSPWKKSGVLANKLILAGTAGEPQNIREYCPYCKDYTTWQTTGTHGSAYYQTWQNRQRAALFPSSSQSASRDTSQVEHFGFFSLDFKCLQAQHQLVVYVKHSANNTVEKIGQFPSLAEFGFSEYKDLRKLLSTHSAQDDHDFGAALGLFAHGVGAGSFVYLRRILERLVTDRFLELRDENEWQEQTFNEKRMAEKIDFLKEHLPPFLVDNKAIYSVLSQGVHELSEEVCLAAFPVVREAIVQILQEELKRKREASQAKEAKKDLDKLATALKAEIKT